MPANGSMSSSQNNEGVIRAAITRIAETVAAWRGEEEDGATITRYQNRSIETA